MNRFEYRLDISGEKLEGPWPCEACHQISQFAVVTSTYNKIFCKNENCRYERIVDKQRCRIVENDGTVWLYDEHGAKWRVRA